MPIEKATIKCESVFSDNSEHRFLLSKIWDKNKPLANVITISPSADYNVSTDLTTNLITNNLNLLGFGGFVLTNLISKIGIDPKRVKNCSDLWTDETDKYIIESAQKCDSIIIAWGHFTQTRKLFEEREECILKLIRPYKDKTYQISDGNDRNYLHPLTPNIRNNWDLIKIAK